MTEQLQSVTWLSSYPKSGNTWLRLLLEAYRCNGALDINDIRICTSDGGAPIMQGVSPISLDQLGFRGEALLRPAALLNLFCRLTNPVLVKTHWANVQPPGLPSFIPKEFTEKAVYVVRDPRSVLPSFASFFQFPIDKAIIAMNEKDFVIGGHGIWARSMISSWSNHAASWIGEKDFPVHIIRYEDMATDAAKELTEVLEFLGYEVDEDRVARAVEATRISKLQEAEKEKGFREHRGNSTSFFGNGGGSRWQEELGPKWIKQIEEDHSEMMKTLEYI
jgi:aryl sulfotransferase